MQEHIRRAHPEYYLPKLPATKESFELMITTPPHERPAVDPNHANHHHHHHGHSHSHSHSHSGSSQQHQHVQHSDPSGLSPALAFDTGLNSSLEGYHSFGTMAATTLRATRRQRRYTTACRLNSACLTSIVVARLYLPPPQPLHWPNYTTTARTRIGEVIAWDR